MYTYICICVHTYIYRERVLKSDVCNHSCNMSFTQTNGFGLQNVTYSLQPQDVANCPGRYQGGPTRQDHMGPIERKSPETPIKEYTLNYSRLLFRRAILKTPISLY